MSGLFTGRIWCWKMIEDSLKNGFVHLVLLNAGVQDLIESCTCQATLS